MTERQSSPAAARNRGPILEVLRGVLPPKARVLELASGSGEHGVYFAQAMPGWEWQPSDPDATARASISAWIDEAALTNARAPMEIDARDEQWPVIGSFDAFVAINMIHISPWEATLGLMRGASRMLVAKGVLFTYGPYKRDGRHTAPSNEAFDVSLKTRNPAWGVRDVGEVEAAAHAQGLVLSELVEMPANNLSLVFARNS
jgi:cyclopropane fatty-acyl-phospholipid synthase-like methyltransferase